MLESLLGAVYLNSREDLNIVQDVLRRLGHWEVLECIINHDMDVQYPLSRLNMWAGVHFAAGLHVIGGPDVVAVNL